MDHPTNRQISLSEITEAVQKFLIHLDPTDEARFTVEHYTDYPSGDVKQNPDPLGGQHNDLSPDEVLALIPKLIEINKRGAGIFVARNQFRGRRRIANLHRVRGVHADMDEASEQQLEELKARLAPSISVRTSEGHKQHLYWQLATDELMEVPDAKAINQRLSKKYGSDSAAVDVARLLRLPGFKHMKYRAQGVMPTVEASYSGLTYTTDELKRAFPPDRLGDAHEGGFVRTGKDMTLTLSEPLADIAKSIAEKHPNLWTSDWSNAVRPSGEIGYPSSSEADMALVGYITRACRKAGFDSDQLEDAVEAVFNSSSCGSNKKWQTRPDYRALTIGKALSRSNAILIDHAPDGILLESHGDIRNAKAFAQAACGKFLFVATRDRWLTWRDSKWSVCEKDEHVAMAKEVCGRILAAAGSVFGQDQERGKRLVQEAMAAHSLARITAMLKLAISEPGMATTDSELDSNPYLLGVGNGVIDLRSGQHLFNQPDMLITRYCNARYLEGATCPRWLNFLDQIFEGDAQTVESVQRLAGCTLLGLSSEEVLIICFGHGSNGKSVFSNVMHKIMGGYSVTAPPSLLTVRRQDDAGPRNDLAALAGRRYVSINETQAGDRLDEQVVKMLAGREPISARFLHQEFFEFTPSFTPWLRTNHRPIITGLDDGIWRRLVLLPFSRKFSDDERDPDLERKLFEELDGILMWMVQGAKLYLRDGIKLSPRMRAEGAAYRSESDLLGEFLADETSAASTAKVHQAVIYSKYRTWCEQSGVRPLSKKSFTQRLAERGFPEGKSGKYRFYVGLAMWSGEASSTQDGVDRINGGLGISSDELLLNTETQNQPTSRPSGPTSSATVWEE